MKIALGLEYDGTDFYGWQIQHHELRTIQGTVEKALSQIANEPIQTICAGRTDTGVHAFGQVIHFETNSIRTERSWVLGTNSNLPDDVAIKWAKVVNQDFDARRSAQSRLYRYTICNQAHKPSLYRYYVTWFPRGLDENKMLIASQDLLGEHNFTSFRGADCQSKTPFRHIDSINITREGAYIFIDIQANAFLHHMVRNIVGVLLAIGVGEQPIEWAKQVLLACDRQAGGVTAPASGLCLKQVFYPKVFNLPSTDSIVTFYSF